MPKTSKKSTKTKAFEVFDDNKSAPGKDIESRENPNVNSRKDPYEKTEESGIFLSTESTVNNQILSDTLNASLDEDSLNESDDDYFEETHDESCDCSEPHESTAGDKAADALPQEGNDQYSPNPFEIRAKENDSFKRLLREATDNPLPDSGEDSLVDTQSLQGQENKDMSKDYNLNSEIAAELTNSNMKAQGRTEQTLLYKNLPLEQLVNEIAERDKMIAELKEYIDRLLLRVMDKCPGVLLHPVPSSKN